MWLPARQPDVTKLRTGLPVRTLPRYSPAIALSAKCLSWLICIITVADLLACCRKFPEAA